MTSAIPTIGSFDGVDREWLYRAYKIAAGFSNDPQTQVGAILVNPTQGRLVLVAANQFPQGIEEKPSRWKRPTKYTYVIHAERNLIYKAARQGIQTDGLTMYAPWLACSDCAQAIIQSGIRRLVGHKQMFNKTPKRWKKSVTAGTRMMIEAGVRVVLVSCNIKGVELRFDGKIWKP